MRIGDRQVVNQYGGTCWIAAVLNMLFLDHEAKKRLVDKNSSANIEEFESVDLVLKQWFLEWIQEYTSYATRFPLMASSLSSRDLKLDELSKGGYPEVALQSFLRSESRTEINSAAAPTLVTEPSDNGLTTFHCFRIKYESLASLNEKCITVHPAEEYISTDNVTINFSNKYACTCDKVSFKTKIPLTYILFWSQEGLLINYISGSELKFMKKGVPNQHSETQYDAVFAEFKDDSAAKAFKKQLSELITTKKETEEILKKWNLKMAGVGGGGDGGVKSTIHCFGFTENLQNVSKELVFNKLNTPADYQERLPRGMIYRETKQESVVTLDIGSHPLQPVRPTGIFVTYEISPGRHHVIVIHKDGEELNHLNWGVRHLSEFEWNQIYRLTVVYFIPDSPLQVPLNRVLFPEASATEPAPPPTL